MSKHRSHFTCSGYLVEAPLAKRDATAEGEKTLDRATCQVYEFAQALTILSAFCLAGA